MPGKSVSDTIGVGGAPNEAASWPSSHANAPLGLGPSNVSGCRPTAWTLARPSGSLFWLVASARRQS